MLHSPKKYLILGIYLGLTLITFATFARVCQNGFVDYDDDKYVTHNEHVKNGFSKDSIIWAFTKPHVANWHPLTSMSHMLDCELFGLDPLGHHLVSLFLHIISTLLLFSILKNATTKIWPAAIVAAIFAIHPLRMESVAWISERKDVLSGMFWMLTMYAYICYTKKPAIKRYIPIVLFLILGLMSKPMVITLPFVLLLMDYWPLQRLMLKSETNVKEKKIEPACEKIKKFSARFLILEKIPLFLLIIASSIITFIFQRLGGAMDQYSSMPLIQRLSNAAVSYFSYIGKIFYPAKLAVFYPHPGSNLPVWHVILAVLILLSITLLVFLIRKTKPYLLIGWLWFVGTMVPVIGIIQVGSQAMADRYTYIPSIGIYIAIVWLAVDLVKNNAKLKVTASILTGVFIASLTSATFFQLQYWKNNGTLFAHALAVTKNNHIMQNNYGNFLGSKKQYPQAIEHFKTALAIKEDYALARNNLAKAYNDWGVALQKENNIDLAMQKWQAALEVKPNHSKANYNTGLILSKQGKYDQAIKYFEEVIKAEPKWEKPYNDLALAYEKQGKHDLAIENYKKSIQLKPDYLNAHYNLGCAYYKSGQLELVVKQWEKTIEIKPDFAEVLNNLAIILVNKELSDVYNPTAAIEYAKRASQLTDYKQASTLSNLAVAYAATGQTDLAIETAKKALPLALASGQKGLADKIQKFLDSNNTSLPDGNTKQN